MEPSITETLMMESSFDRREDGVVGVSLVDDSVVSGGQKGIVMESDEKISWVLENGVDDQRFGENLVESGVDRNISDAGELHAVNVVVDLSSCSTKESDSNTVGSNVVRLNDVEFIEKEGEYEFTDLVWGKVKNYPWWPGQIINPSDSTDEAKKHLKKDGLLVAYFGDQTFAFNELHNIRPFRVSFCRMEDQCNGEAFVRAVNLALREAARRVECGLTCLCISDKVYDKVRSQIVVNSAIKKECSRIDGGDRFSSVNSFNPAKTVDILLNLAKDPFGINRLDVSTIGGQLSAFNRWEGYHQLQLNQVLDDKSVVINTALHSKGKPNARGRPRKRKHLFDDGLSPSKKVRCLSELMSNGDESVSDVEYTPKKRGGKRKAVGSNGCGEGNQSQSQSQTADEFLSQICLAAINPIEGQHNLDLLVKFSLDFKNYRLREEMKDKEVAKQQESIETDEFTGVKDSYWTDMTIVTESNFRPKPNEENSATSLTFKFKSLDSVPSVKKLHEIFGRFGPLQETETRVLKKTKCVKLVFERKCDAETAFSSSGKFSIFGPALVKYRLNFSPTLRKTDATGNKGLKSAKKPESEN